MTESDREGPSSTRPSTRARPKLELVDGVLGPMHPAIRRPTPREKLFLHCKAREEKEREQMRTARQPPQQPRRGGA
jgi:hypothetical protein